MPCLVYGTKFGSYSRFAAAVILRRRGHSQIILSAGYRFHGDEAIEV